MKWKQSQKEGGRYKEKKRAKAKIEKLRKCEMKFTALVDEGK